MGELAALGMAERVRVDTGRVQNIVDELGEIAAKGLIQMALEQMALAVRTLQRVAREGDSARTVAKARRLSRLACQVGLVSLSRVADDVAHCADRQDAVALDATLARTVRVANRSLSEIWDGV
ncbi:hypothetical protein SAMN05421538_101362 [Paracoccus isoporae]|uniref:Uncharacterized protein n=1 Tax=Paracoccus isoporae TaxID=591205 RepID=A0A1G6TUU0_9RHOB|nr:hypothetical protein [Paracoccus isoporae]SDD32147.1 hypothetical protein SAMN05421538_101362 [Paracoccus isoporae]